MKIEFRQTGGIAGLVKSADIDSDELSAEDAEVLKSLVDQSGFFSLPEPALRGKPDEEQYSITIEIEGRSRRIYMNKSETPKDLRQLITYLTKLAKYEKRK